MASHLQATYADGILRLAFTPGMHNPPQTDSAKLTAPTITAWAFASSSTTRTCRSIHCTATWTLLLQGLRRAKAFPWEVQSAKWVIPINNICAGVRPGTARPQYRRAVHRLAIHGVASLSRIR